MKLDHGFSKKFKKGTLIASLIVLGIVIPVILFQVFGRKQDVEAGWFDDSWAYRKNITFGNTGASAFNQKVNIAIDTSTPIAAGIMQSDCGDSRFTDYDGKILRYYIASGCNTTTTQYWVLTPLIITGTNSVYHYYGNPNALNGTENAQFSESTFSPTSGPTILSQETGQGPISYWNFDEGMGSTANDATQQNNDLTITGAIWKSDDMCVSGKCLAFDGIVDNANKQYSSDTELLPGTGSFTVSSWFKHVSISTATTAATTDILISRVDAVQGVGWKIYMNGSSQMCFGIDQTAGGFPIDWACSTTTYTDSKWHYVSAVKNGTSSVSIYIDGLLAATDTSITSSSISGTNAPLNIGNDFDNGINGWNGFIDEVRYYNFAKTDSQIKTEFASRGTTKGTAAQFGGGNPSGRTLSSGLAAYYKLESDGTDSSYNSADLMRTGNAAFASGKYLMGSEHVPASAPQFFASSPTLDGTKSISFWVNPDTATNYFLSFNNGTIQSSSGIITTTNLVNPKIYVNGKLSTALTTDAWQQVTVTTDTALDYKTSSHVQTLNFAEVGQDGSKYCVTANDCKTVYYNSGDGSLRFMDCDNANCSSGTITILDGAPGCTLTGGDACDSTLDLGQYTDIACPTANDCKIVYYDVTNTALMFADCDDATCSSGSVEILDGMAGCRLNNCSTNIAGQFAKLACPTAGDCKISYYDGSSTALMFADCADATCSTSSPTDGLTRVIDGGGGCTLSGCASSGAMGQYSSLFCVTANDCRVAYYNASSSALSIAICADNTCSGGSAVLLDGGSGCVLSGCETATIAGQFTSLYCPAADNCKIAYNDATNTNLVFADCNDTACSGGSAVILDGRAGCALTGCDTSAGTGQYNSIYCPTSSDCKITYWGNGALTFADCSNETCSASGPSDGIVRYLDGIVGCTLTGGDGCNTATNSGQYSDISCATADDCKISFRDITHTAVLFADCDDATCSTGQIQFIDGYNSNVGQHGSIYCISANDCKMAYYDGVSTSLKFMDCDDATCTSGPVSLLDGAPGCVLNRGYPCNTLGSAGGSIDVDTGLYTSIFCPTADDCKITYEDNNNSTLMFADCDDAQCSTGSIQVLDGATGCVLTGGDGCNTSNKGLFTNLSCPTADDCKISYYDLTNTAVKFADCDNGACSSGSVRTVDGMSGCGLGACGTGPMGQYNSLYCPAADNCKIAYSDNNSALMFADCDDATCSTGTVKIVDGNPGCGLNACGTSFTSGLYNSIYCPTSSDCKIAFQDSGNTALTFADCDDETCSTGTIQILDGKAGCVLTGVDVCDTATTTGQYTDIFCPTAGDCKISYYDAGNTALMFADCEDSTCSTGSVSILDGMAGCRLTSGDVCDDSISAGQQTGLYCPAADDCKISYRSFSNNAMMFGDCADATCSSGSTTFADTGMASTLVVGKVGSNYFDGTMDEIRIYNKELSAFEVESLYNWAPAPVGWWKMEEKTGTSTSDISGNTNTATLFNTPTWTQGKIGSGLSFDGNTQYANTPTTNFPAPASDSYSISMWVNPTNIPSSGRNPRLFTYNTDSNNGFAVVIGGAALNSKLGFSVKKGGSTYGASCASACMTTGTWQHVAAVFDSTTNTANVYLNGVRQTGADGLFGLGTSGSGFIAALSSGGGDSASAYNGAIDNLKFYNYARSQKQIVEDVNEGLPVSASLGSQTILWPFNEMYGTTAYNSVLTQQTLTGVLGTGTSAPTWIPATNCKINGCLYFDSGSDNVDGGDVAFTDALDQMTVSFWLDPLTLATNKSIISKNNASQKSFAIVTDASNSSEIRVHIAATLAEADNTTYFTTSGLGLSASAWQHVAVVYDGNQTAPSRIRVYKDGKEISGTYTGTIPTSMTSGPTSVLRVGDDQSSTYTSLVSRIDEVKIYSGALNQYDVLMDLNNNSISSLGGVITTQDNASIIGTAPIGWWKLDENQGTSQVSDSSGNGWTLTMVSAPGWTVGKYGSALNFNGTQPNLKSVSLSAANVSGPITVEAWIKPTVSSQTYQPAEIVSKTAAGFYYRLEVFTGNVVRFRTFGVSNDILTSNGAVNVNQWNHLAAVYDGSNKYIYINGMLDISVAASGTMSTSADALFIGGYDGGTRSIWQGLIDDVKIYDYARTAAQVAYDYNGGAPMAWYTMDECQGSTVYNMALNANGQAAGMNGNISIGSSAPQTSTGSCGSGSSSEAWANGTSGKFDSSLNFDGSDDVVSTADIDYGGSNQVSVSAWFKYSSCSGNSSQCYLVSKGQFNSSVPYQLWVSNGGSTANFVVNGTTVAATGSYANNSWHHIVGTLDGFTCSVYVDGIFKNSSACTPISNNELTTIGGDDADATYRPFNGQIDDVRIYGYALNNAQIKQVYIGGAAQSFGQ